MQARLAALCVRHGVTLCSDEVWGEVALSEDTAPFTSCLTLLPPEPAAGGAAAAAAAVFAAAASAAADDAGAAAAGGVAGLRERLVVLTSPSKTHDAASLELQPLTVLPP